MSRRKKPFDRAQQLKAVLAYAKGLATAHQTGAKPVTLPLVNGLTLEEIEAKYGPVTRREHEQH